MRALATRDASLSLSLRPQDGNTPEFDKFFKEEEMSSDDAIKCIQLSPSSAFTKFGVRRERLQLKAAAPLTSRPLSPRSQTCKHILLHYACKSESSTEALFKSLTTKETVYKDWDDQKRHGKAKYEKS